MSTHEWADQMLAAVWRAYASDAAVVEEQRKRDAQREEAVPELRGLVNDFAEAREGIASFRKRLHAFAIQYQHLWGFSGHGMMTVNQLAKGAVDEDEADIRSAVSPPATAEDAQERLALLVAVAQRQKERAKAAGNPKGGPAPGHAPYVLSFLWEAFDRDAWPVYFVNTRDALEGMERFSQTGDPVADYRAFTQAVAEARALLGVSTWDLEHACAWWMEHHFAGLVRADFSGLARNAELNATHWNARAGYASPEVEHEARTNIGRVLHQLDWLAGALHEATPDLLEERTALLASERSSWSATGRYRTDAWVAMDRGEEDHDTGLPGFRIWMTADELLVGVTLPVGDDEQQDEAIAQVEDDIARVLEADFALVTATEGDAFGQAWEAGAGRALLARRWSPEQAVEAGPALLNEIAEVLATLAPVLERWETAEPTGEPGVTVIDVPEGVPDRAWLVRPNVERYDHLDSWLEQEIVAIGWAEAGPIEPGTPKEEIRELLEAGYPDKTAAQIRTDLSTVARFVNDIQPGHLVVTPRDEQLYLATVISDAYWSAGVDDPRRRRVVWHNADAPLHVDALPAELVEALRSHIRALGDLSAHRLTVARLAGLVGDGDEEQLTFDPERLELYVKLADFDWVTAEETVALHKAHADAHGAAWFGGNFSIGGKLDDFRRMLAEGYHPKLVMAQPGKGLVAVAPILEAHSQAEPRPCPDAGSFLLDTYEPDAAYKTWLRIGQVRTVDELDTPVAAEDFVVASNPAQRASDLLNRRPSYAYLRYAPATVELTDEPLTLPSAERFERGFERISEELAVDRSTVERIVANLVAGKSVILTGPTGSGKTALAHRIPREFFDIDAHVVTATADWTGYEVIGGIFPQVTEDEDGNAALTYGIRRGHVYEAVHRNWKTDESGNLLRRDGKPVRRRDERDGRPVVGTWLVIDEFNRADIDKAFGELFTAIEYGSLPVPVADPGEPAATRPLPIPQHFRIIGTMNSFDRHYLFTISDALKRRFAFVEVGLPRETGAERSKVRQRVQARLAERSLEVDDDALAEAEGVLYGFLEFARVFRPVGVAQAMASLEYAAVRSAQAEPDPSAFLAEALVANVVPQLEGLSTDQLGMLRHWAAGDPGAAVRACTQLLEHRGPALTTRRDIGRVAAFLAVHGDGEMAKRSSAVAEAVEHEADDEDLGELLDGDAGAEDPEARAWAELVGESIAVEALPEVADALQALIDDAAI
jgi:MoxR-like ATPase